jgi:hypothetical protein
MAVEAGSIKIHVESFAKLLRRFGYRVGVVRSPE